MSTACTAPLAKELKTPAKGKTSPRVKLVEIPDAKLTASVATIQGLSPYLGTFAVCLPNDSRDPLACRRCAPS